MNRTEKCVEFHSILESLLLRWHASYSASVVACASRPGMKLRTITYRTGMNTKFSVVAAIIPPKTVVPTETRPARPAPCANTSGTTPKMNASEVIKMGRSRMRAASPAQLLRKFDDQNGVFAGKSDQHDKSNLAVHVILQSAQCLRAERAKNRDRHGQQHDKRKHVTLVLRRQRQVHHHQA